MAHFRNKSVQSVTARISLLDHDVDFQLYFRPLSLGANLTVQYYWMDSSGFRITRRKRRLFDPINFRSCLTHWWLAVRSQGLNTDPLQLRHLMMANCYSIFSANKSLQAVYRDAFLPSGATVPESQSLPDAIRRRIRKTVRAQDVDGVRKELNDLLMGPGASRLPENEDVLIRKVWNGFVNHGMDLMQESGSAGWEMFLGKLDAWSARRRKKGGQEWIRRFLNVLAYECKICFYRCYSNAWNDLIPWLREHHHLDKMSERFLRFWHAQNQPQNDADGMLVADVFAGHVLSLHPLSGFLMQDRTLRAIAGQFFASDEYDQVMESRQPVKSREYWNLIGAILTAAHFYRQAAKEQSQRRGVRLCDGEAVEHVEQSCDNSSGTFIIEEFLATRGVECSQCHALLRCRQFHPEDGQIKSFTVDLRCSKCNRDLSHSVDSVEFQAWLLTK